MESLNPSSHLTADSNAAQPALTSHHVSIALAQVRHAAEAQITPSTTVDYHSPKQKDDDQSDGLSLPPITPMTASRASTIPPTDPDIEVSDHASTAAKKNQEETKACTKTIGYVIIFIRYAIIVMIPIADASGNLKQMRMECTKMSTSWTSTLIHQATPQRRTRRPNSRSRSVFRGCVACEW